MFEIRIDDVLPGKSLKGGRMKCVMCFLITAVVVTVVSAQPKHPVEPMAVHDSMLAAGKALDMESAKLNLQERRLGLAEKAQELVIREEERGKIFRDEISEMVNPGTGPWGTMYSHGRMMRHPMWAKAFFGMMFCIMLIINILLTSLVTMDMARNKRFNGLWIPILLVAGIPGTAIYALFRLGDIVAAQEAKPK